MHVQLLFYSRECEKSREVHERRGATLVLRGIFPYEPDSAGGDIIVVLLLLLSRRRARALYTCKIRAAALLPASRDSGSAPLPPSSSSFSRRGLASSASLSCFFDFRRCRDTLWKKKGKKDVGLGVFFFDRVNLSFFFSFFNVVMFHQQFLILYYRIKGNWMITV